MNFDEPAESDCKALSELVFASKASHGYSAAFMQMCREEILVTAASLRKGPSQMAWSVARTEPEGFVQIVGIDNQVCELEALFVASQAHGQGIGKILFGWATHCAGESGYSRMRINSDPGALPFYLSVGAKQVGETPSGSIPGRVLPQLLIDVRAPS